MGLLSLLPEVSSIGEEYQYGKSPRIITQQEFEGLLSESKFRDNGKEGKSHSSGIPDRVTMIQCIGPSEEYCSRICCTTALKNALKLKELNPSAKITIIYRDIRTYGFKERLYTQAREAGVRFIHFEFDQKPKTRCRYHRLLSSTCFRLGCYPAVTNRWLRCSPDHFRRGTKYESDIVE